MVMVKNSNATEVHKVYSADELQELLLRMGFPVRISRPYANDNGYSHFVQNTVTSIPMLWDDIVDPSVGELWVEKVHNEGQN